jgi:hypothetical protein
MTQNFPTNRGFMILEASGKKRVHAFEEWYGEVN